MCHKTSYYIILYTIGRQCLAESAGFGRLAVVYLDRNHTYENEDKRGMDLIQAELSSKIMQLAPQNLPKHYKVYICMYIYVKPNFPNKLFKSPSSGLSTK